MLGGVRHEQAWRSWPAEPPVRPPPTATRDRRARRRAAATARALGRRADRGALVVFAAFAAGQGRQPDRRLRRHAGASTLDPVGDVEQIFIRAAPIVARGPRGGVPARAGLVNVGGEGQIIMGGVAARGVGSPSVDAERPRRGCVMLRMIARGDASAGALWAGIAAVLRLRRQASTRRSPRCSSTTSRSTRCSSSSTARGRTPRRAGAAHQRRADRRDQAAGVRRARRAHVGIVDRGARRGRRVVRAARTTLGLPALGRRRQLRGRPPRRAARAACCCSPPC